MWRIEAGRETVAELKAATIKFGCLGLAAIRNITWPQICLFGRTKAASPSPMALAFLIVLRTNSGLWVTDCPVQKANPQC